MSRGGCGDAETTKVLVEHNAMLDMPQQTEDGETALYVACPRGAEQTPSSARKVRSLGVK